MQFACTRAHAADFVVRRVWIVGGSMTTGELTGMFSWPRDADPDEPDDGSDGFRYDHHG